MAEPEVSRRLPQFIPGRHANPGRSARSSPRPDRHSIEGDAAYTRLDFRVALLLNIAKLEKKGWMTPAFVNDNTLEFRMNDLRMSLAAWVACPVRNGRREQALYVIPRPKAGAQVEWKRETWHTQMPGPERQARLAERAGSSLPDTARQLESGPGLLRRLLDHFAGRDLLQIGAVRGAGSP